jgi:hypothetical protein
MFLSVSVARRRSLRAGQPRELATELILQAGGLPVPRETP